MSDARQGDRSEWIPCRYFAFWDVPRSLVVRHQGRSLLLDSQFDDELDDYSPEYRVRLLDSVSPEEFDALSWSELENRVIEELSNLSIAEVAFDRERFRQGGNAYARMRFRSDPIRQRNV